MPGKYEGLDKYGKPKSDYLDKLTKLSEPGLSTETEDMIWLSAYANNNPRSDYHWKADACHDEWKRRGKLDGYTKAWRKASGKED